MNVFAFFAPALMMLAQITTPTDITSVTDIVQLVVGNGLAALFVWLYIRAQNQLVDVQKDTAQTIATIQKETAAALGAVQKEASATIAAEYQKMAEQRREENAAMRNLLFDLARRGISGSPLDTQPIRKVDIQAALAQQRAQDAIEGATATSYAGAPVP